MATPPILPRYDRISTDRDQQQPVSAMFSTTSRFGRFTRRHWLATVAAGGCGGAGGLVAESVFVTPCALATTQLAIGKPNGTRRPLRLIQLSDLHIRGIGRLETDLLAAVTAAEPDLILLTGDTLDCRRGIEPLTEFLQALPAGPDRVAIIGNWEYKAGIAPDRFRQLLGRHDVRLLCNESIDIAFNGLPLRITGLDDLVCGQPGSPRPIAAADPMAEHLLLAHCPAARDQLPPLAGPAVSLMLSGHTHGGQIAPAGLPIVTPPGSGRYVTGWYVEGGPPMYVSRGIGTSTLPIRLGASPELVIVDWWLGDSNDAQPLQSA